MSCIKYNTPQVVDADPVLGAIKQLKSVARFEHPCFFDPQIESHAAADKKSAWKGFIVHPNPELETREPRLGNHNLCRSNLVSIANNDGFFRHPGNGKIFAKLGCLQRFNAQLFFPRLIVARRINIDRLVTATMHFEIGLTVAVQMQKMDANITVDGPLENSGSDVFAVKTNVRWHADADLQNFPAQLITCLDIPKRPGEPFDLACNFLRHD